MTTHNSTRARDYGAQVQLSTKQQVIGCVQGNIGLHGISQVRKLKHRNTDSNRSTGGNKDYKSKIGRKGGDARLKTLSKGSTEDRGEAHINSTALSAKKQNTRRSTGCNIQYNDRRTA